jgi:hypothetical protein
VDEDELVLLRSKSRLELIYERRGFRGWVRVYRITAPGVVKVRSYCISPKGRIRCGRTQSN